MKMPSFISYTFFCCVPLLLAGCASSIQVTHYPTPQEDRLPTFKNYCWATGKAADAITSLAPTSGHNQFFDPTIRASMNEILKEKGYASGPCTTADFMIDYRMGIHEDVAAADTSIEDSLHDYGAKWSFGKQDDIQYEGISPPEEILITVQHGTLHIAAFTVNGELLWHSEAEKVLNERSTDAERLQTVRNATDKVMQYFPSR